MGPEDLVRGHWGSAVPRWGPRLRRRSLPWVPTPIAGLSICITAANINRNEDLGPAAIAVVIIITFGAFLRRRPAFFLCPKGSNDGALPSQRPMSRVLAGRKNPYRRTTSAAEMADFRSTFYMGWIASKSSAVTKRRQCLRDPRPYLA